MQETTERLQWGNLAEVRSDSCLISVMNTNESVILHLIVLESSMAADHHCHVQEIQMLRRCLYKSFAGCGLTGTRQYLFEK